MYNFNSKLLFQSPRWNKLSAFPQRQKHTGCVSHLSTTRVSGFASFASPKSFSFFSKEWHLWYFTERRKTQFLGGKKGLNPLVWSRKNYKDGTAKWRQRDIIMLIKMKWSFVKHAMQYLSFWENLSRHLNIEPVKVQRRL